MSHSSRVEKPPIILTQRVYLKLLTAWLWITICHVMNDYFCIIFNKVNFIANNRLLWDFSTPSTEYRNHGMVSESDIFTF